MNRPGWICPRCERVWAPEIAECGACSVQTPVVGYWMTCPACGQAPCVGIAPECPRL
jgi:hypothetical protein